MKKLLILSVLLSVIFGAGLVFGVKYISENLDAIQLKQNRPDLFNAVLKVQAEEEKKMEAAISQTKENSVKQILSPLVIEE